MNTVVCQGAGGNEIKGIHGKTKPEGALQRPVTAMSHEERDTLRPSADMDRRKPGIKKLKRGADFCLPGEYPNTILFLHTSNKHKMEL